MGGGVWRIVHRKSARPFHPDESARGWHRTQICHITVVKGEKICHNGFAPAFDSEKEASHEVKSTFGAEELRYLRLLARQYPTVQAASTEIINLQAIMNLPKGTEHFISDIHGEYEAFLHILNSCSGVVKEKLDEIFSTSLTRAERDELATLIYYPEEKLELVRRETKDLQEWYRITLHRLMELCRWVSSKYTRSKVRKALPKDYAYIIDELLHTHYNEEDKRDYYENIINTIIDIDQAPGFIEAVCSVIKRMAVDHLHIVGDIFDGAPGGHYYGLSAGLPQCGYPVGEPRCTVDGGGLRLPNSGGNRAGQFHPL